MHALHEIHPERGDGNTFSSLAEFIDAFDHGKEEKVYALQELRLRMQGYSEDIRTFLIEHELTRGMAIMLRPQIQVLKPSSQTDVMEERTGGNRKRSYGIPNYLNL